MNDLNEPLELFQLIAESTENVHDRALSRHLRALFLNKIEASKLIKNAFDTRRINQETDYNPRRGLQNYHRSEKFISEGLSNKIQAFSKLSNLLDKLKSEYGREPQWQDSYTRVLSSSVHKGLRTDQLDGDYSEVQPSMASLDYLEELMHVRYRLSTDDLLKMSEVDLRKRLIDKDEILTHVTGNYSPVISTSDVNKYSYDQMMDKMLNTIMQVMSSYKPAQPDDNLTNKLFDVKATPDAPEIERTVTINIKDKISNKIEKNGDVAIAEKENKEITVG